MKNSIDLKHNLKEAAVMVPIYKKNNGDTVVVLVRRTKGGLHSGQLAFPGGRKDLNDKTILATALREAEEEIGLSSDRITILENLSVVDVMATGFRIYPFLARIIPPEKWNRQKDEVAEIIEMTIQELTKPHIHTKDFHTVKEWPKPRLINFYRIGQYRLWGATYRILHPLMPRLLAGEWKL